MYIYTSICRHIERQRFYWCIASHRFPLPLDVVRRKGSFGNSILTVAMAPLPHYLGKGQVELSTIQIYNPLLSPLRVPVPGPKSRVGDKCVPLRTWHFGLSSAKGIRVSQQRELSQAETFQAEGTACGEGKGLLRVGLGWGREDAEQVGSGVTETEAAVSEEITHCAFTRMTS